MKYGKFPSALSCFFSYKFGMQTATLILSPSNHEIVSVKLACSPDPSLNPTPEMRPNSTDSPRRCQVPPRRTAVAFQPCSCERDRAHELGSHQSFGGTVEVVGMGGGGGKGSGWSNLREKGAEPRKGKKDKRDSNQPP